MADENELDLSDDSVEINDNVVHRRVGHIAVPYKHYIVVWGGFMSGEEDVEVYCSPKRIWFYDCTTELWSVRTTKGTIPFPNSGSTAVIMDDFLYVYGGVEELTEDLWRYGSELHRLDLKTFTWSTLTTIGNSPKGSDKAVGWVYNNKIYIFGGYGQCTRLLSHRFAFDVDPLNHLDRGWNNQLSIYDPETNRWSTPRSGGKPPRPRAAHAIDLWRDKVYIFGGRLVEMRVNDMYVLDLKTLHWTEIRLKDGTYEIPEGRSWHSFNFISEKRAVLFGGLSRNEEPCGDWWECEIDNNEVTWHQKGSVPKDQTLVWHRAVISQATKELVMVGGVTCSPYDMKEENHVNKLHVIPFTPASLLRLSLQEVVKEGVIVQLLQDDGYLPKCLMDLVIAKLSIRDAKTFVNRVDQINAVN